MNASELPAVRRLPKSGTHVAITLDRASEHALWADLSLDVAATGGVFVATYVTLGVGTVVDMLLTLEGEELPIAARGVVRWTRPHRDGSDGPTGVGVKLLDPTPETAARLARFAESVREPIVFDLEDLQIRARSSAALRRVRA